MYLVLEFFYRSVLPKPFRLERDGDRIAHTKRNLTIGKTVKSYRIHKKRSRRIVFHTQMTVENLQRSLNDRGRAEFILRTH